MGAVLKGRDVDLGRDLAVKVLLEEHRDNPEMVRRFVEEAQIGGQLQHPGIVPVYELGRLADGRLYFAMKLVQGRTLAALLDGRDGPGRRPAAVPRDLRAGLPDDGLRPRPRRDPPRPEAVERHGRQLRRGPGHGLGPRQGPRPGRASPTRSGRSGAGDDVEPVRTLRTGSAADDSRAGSVLGTPAYMAPEQARGELDTLDERADVFGLGAILCEILTGLPPYTGPSGDEIYGKAARADLADALARLDACGADAELVALASPAWPRRRGTGRGTRAWSSPRLTAYLAGVQERLRAAELARARAEARAAEERKRRLLVAGLAASLLALAAWAAAAGSG